MTHTVAAFYRFTPIVDAAALKTQLKPLFAALDLCGTLLIAPEGINGTMAGQGDAVERILDVLHQHVELKREDVKFSQATDKPFNRLKIRLKREIITFKQPDADPSRLAGIYVEPRDWNGLIADPEVVVLDTRNLYETAIGKFANARDPQIDHFTDFAGYVRTQLDPARDKKIAMYCTGGIRCEKASAFMRAEGFDQVYHLKGGILKYLEDIPEAESKWRGACYVFDKRMAVGHGLTSGDYRMCFCCGYALSPQDRGHEHFEAGVSCAYCYSQSSAKDKARFRDRHRRMTQGAPVASADSNAVINPLYWDKSI